MQSMTLVEAEKLALETLKQVMEERIQPDNIEIAQVTSAGFRAYTREEIEQALERIQ